MREYRTTYTTITSAADHQELTPVVPSNGKPENWQLIGTAAALDSQARCVVFWTWQNDAWWPTPNSPPTTEV